MTLPGPKRFFKHPIRSPAQVGALCCAQLGVPKSKVERESSAPAGDASWKEKKKTKKTTSPQRGENRKGREQNILYTPLTRAVGVCAICVPSLQWACAAFPETLVFQAT